MVSKGKKLNKKCIKLAPDPVVQAVFLNCSSITQYYPYNSFISHKPITQFIIPLSSLRSLEIKATSSWTSRQGCLAMSSLMCPSPVKLKEHKKDSHKTDLGWCLDSINNESHMIKENYQPL